MKLDSDLFLLEGSKGSILYAPVKNLTARVNKPAAQALLRRHEELPLDADEAEVVEQLHALGFFEPAKPPEFPLAQTPVEVTLFPSDGCNLRCIYCYAAAENCMHRMTFSVAEQAIDLVSQNALDAGYADFSVGFHGNGEPFTNFPLIKQASQYAKKRGEQLGLEAKLTAATNAVLTDEMIDFIVQNFDGLNISFDGLPAIQNTQRPLAGGEPSFPAVNKTLKRIDGAHMHYAIRATVTDESVGHMEDMARFIASEYPNCEKVHIEPAWITGRCIETSVRTAQAEEFIEQFKALSGILASYGIEAVYSSARCGELTNRFCTVCDTPLNVTETGLVTSCFEVANKADPRAFRYIYGRIDDCGISTDAAKSAWLSRLTVDNMPFCHDCFCQYTCGGDCPAKVIGANDPESHAGSDRCTITKALTLHQIEQMLNEAEQIAKESASSTEAAVPTRPTSPMGTSDPTKAADIANTENPEEPHNQAKPTAREQKGAPHGK